MKNLIEIVEKRESKSYSNMNINGIPVKLGQEIWVKDPDDITQECVAKLTTIDMSTKKFRAFIGDNVWEFDFNEFIETVDMAIKREENTKSKNKEKIKKYNNQLKDLEKQLANTRMEWEDDPEVIDAARRGEEHMGYSNAISKIMKKMDDLREKIRNLEYPGKHIQWTDFNGYIKENPIEGIDYVWVDNITNKVITSKNENLEENLNESLLVGIGWLTLLGLMAIATNNVAYKHIHSSDTNDKGLFANIKENGLLSGITLWLYKHVQQISKWFDEYNLSNSIEIIQNSEDFQTYCELPQKDRTLKKLEQICRDCVGTEINKEDVKNIWNKIKTECKEANNAKLQ